MEPARPKCWPGRDRSAHPVPSLPARADHSPRAARIPAPRGWHLSEDALHYLFNFQKEYEQKKIMGSKHANIWNYASMNYVKLCTNFDNN